MRDAKTILINQKIKDNEDVLLASFGFKGIVNSKFKCDNVLEIIKSLSGDLAGNIQLFFDELKKFYLTDRQFIGFREADIDKFIEEERGVIAVKAMSLLK